MISQRPAGNEDKERVGLTDKSGTPRARAPSLEQINDSISYGILVGQLTRYT